MNGHMNDILLANNGKTYLAFVGKRNGATTGEPNPRTGRLSKWGDYYRFATKAERDQFVKEYYHTDNVATACSFNTGRQYSRGMSLKDYAEHIYSLPFLQYKRGIVSLARNRRRDDNHLQSTNKGNKV